MRKLIVSLAIVVLGVISVQTIGRTDATHSKPLLMRNPTLSKTHIVFSYAGDLWKAPREGGQAERLTTGRGNETDPAFSPDGNWIAFTGEYDGNTDVYVMPSAGG